MLFHYNFDKGKKKNRLLVGPLSEWNWRVLPMSRGFLWVLQFPPTPQRCARKVNRCVYTTAVCVSVSGCE